MAGAQGLPARLSTQAHLDDVLVMMAAQRQRDSVRSAPGQGDLQYCAVLTGGLQGPTANITGQESSRRQPPSGRGAGAA